MFSDYLYKITWRHNPEC